MSKILSAKLAIHITKKISELMYWTLYSKRKYSVIANLKIVLKYRDKTIPQMYILKKLVMEIYKNFAEIIYEFLIMPKIKIENLIEIKNKEYLDNAIKKGKGAIALTGHIGNWEIGAATLSKLNYSPVIISLPQQVKYVKSFFTKQRTKVGIKVIHIGDNLKPMLSALKNGKVVATPGDHVYSGPSLKINFFGKQTEFPIGIFEIAERMKVPIIPAFCVKENKKYYLYFEPELKNGLKEWIPILEKYISKYTTQWFTFNKIWN